MVKPNPPKNPNGGTSANAVMVPMLLTAYKNYGEIKAKPNPDQSAYLLPLTPPNLRGLQVGNGLVQHDIFEHHRTPPYMSWADRDRLADNRVGVTLHWSLPKHYRAGIAGSATAADTVAAEKIRGGYVNTDLSNANASVPLFRPAPTRWVVFRRVSGGWQFGPECLYWATDQDRTQPLKSYEEVVGQGLYVDNRVFVIESVWYDNMQKKNTNS